MSLWLQNTLVPAVLTAVVFLVVLWPTRRSGRRLLQTWGVPAPGEDQVGVAVRYLKQRRVLYVVLFLTVPALAGLIWRDDAALPGFGIVVPLLLAMLVAELVATLRPVSGLRVASLDRRSWRDLVPRWAIIVVALLVVLSVGCSVLAFAAGASGWAPLGNVIVCLAVVGLLVWLAVRRPAVADEAVDAALRTRTARVAVGIGFGWLGAALLTAAQELYYRSAVVIHFPDPGPPPPSWLTDDLVNVLQIAGPIAQLTAVGCWIWLANPSRRALAATRSTPTR